uniref:Protein-tyrosine sulfotransferase n=1 Tax=Noctiluca scintillans TaxID=2966 RepID=A0A7S1FFU6_NOCSC
MCPVPQGLRILVMTSVFAGVIGFFLFYDLRSQLLRASSTVMSNTTPSPTTTPATFFPQDWCPSCNDPELCSRKFLFIVGTGRSGSTTLMNMVNLVPHVYLYGENGMTLVPKPVPQVHSGYLRSDSYLAGVPGQDGAWLHPPPDVADRRFRKVFPNYIWTWLEPPAIPGRIVTVRGFKEVRWTMKTLEMIMHVCPCSRFISSFRTDLEAQAATVFQRHRSVDELRQGNVQQREMLGNLSAATFEIPLELFSIEKFNKLAAWLGSNCTFTSVVHSNARDKTKVEKPSKPARCE